MRCAILLLVASSVWAQQTTSLTLEEAIETALANNPAVTAAQRQLAEADARIKQARSGRYPRLGASGIAKAGLSGATNALGLLGLPNSPFFQNFAVSLNAYQPIYDGGRTKFQVAWERRRKEALEAEVRGVESEVVLRTQRAFFGLLRARKSKEVAAEIFKSRELTSRQARAFRDAGLRSQLDLDLAQVGSSRARLQLLEASNAGREAMAEFGHALGSSQDLSYVVVEPEIAIPAAEPLAGLIEEAHRMRPEMHSLRAEQRATAEQIELARSGGKPLLALVFSGGYARFAEVLARQLLTGGAGILYPLFQGGKIKGRVQEAEAHLAVLQSIEEKLKQDIGLEVRRACLRLRNTIESLPTLRLQAESSRRAARLANERYRQRLGTLVELSEAQASLAGAAMLEATGLYEVALADAALRFAVGR